MIDMALSNRIHLVCAFHLLGQGCSSRQWGKFLWRPVERGLVLAISMTYALRRFLPVEVPSSK